MIASLSPQFPTSMKALASTKSEDRVHFVQFTHPGSEHGPDGDTPNLKSWNRGGHRRKFLCAPGEYVSSCGRVKTGDLTFWGEWEPPSSVVRLENSPDEGHPTWLHRPCLPAEDPQRPAGASSCSPVRTKDRCSASCSGTKTGTPQNTDPYVFGPCFKYFVCKQIKRYGSNSDTETQRATWLAKLNVGSVILFGSSKGTRARRNFRFLLDTVFVVGEWLEYDPWHPEGLRGHALVDRDFLHSSFHVALPTMKAGPASSGPKLRLYLGATKDAPCGGMYSFSPARVAANGKPVGFPRVELRNSDFRELGSVASSTGSGNLLTDNLNSAARGVEVSLGDMALVWGKVRDLCRESKCVEGVRFHLTRQR